MPLPPISSVASSENSSDKLRPLALVHEVAIGALQALDLVHVLQARDARIERVQLLRPATARKRPAWRTANVKPAVRYSSDSVFHVHCPVTLSAACGRFVSGCTRHRVLVAERRNVVARHRAIDPGRWLVGREQGAGPLHGQQRPRPAPVVVRECRRIEMQLRDLPDAAFLHVLVLVDAHAPDAVRAGLRELHHALPATRGGPAIRRDGDHRLQLHVVVQVALRQPLRPEQQQRAADAVLADVDAALSVFEAASRAQTGLPCLPTGPCRSR